MLALDADKGKELWRTKDVSEFGERVRVVRDAGDTVLVLVTMELIALDAATGKERWRLTLPHRSRTLVVTDDRLLVVGSGEITCVSRDGRVVWTNALKGLGLQGPALAFGDAFSDDLGG